MGIKANFNFKEIQKRFDEVLDRIDKATIATLKRLGEMCVQEARDNGNYTDQTGNLRSSTGYVIVVRGKIVESAFSTAVKDLNGTGTSRGRAYAEDLAKNVNGGDYALIVVAGMSYAAAVESRSKNVLTSAEMYAKQKLPGMMEQLKKNIDKMRV